MVNKMATYISGGTLTGNNNNKPQSGQGANTVERQTGVENPVFNMSDSNYQGSIHRGQLPPAPSEVSAWQANGTLKDENPMGNFSSRPGSGLSNGKVQNIYWPNGSIPRRVKKLSWEDEQPNRVSASKWIVFQIWIMQNWCNFQHLHFWLWALILRNIFFFSLHKYKISITA